MAFVSGLCIYPIKSCRGIAVSAINLHPHYGIIHDRAWMLVDAEGDCLTQRTFPRMALIDAHVDGPNLIVRAPGMSTADIDYVAWTEMGRLRNVRVHGQPVQGIDYGDGVATWFSTFLRTPCRLIGKPRGLVRSAPQGEGWLAYADAYPLLVISEASLDDLNGRLSEPVPWNRFRPNVMISGVPAYAEDAWQEIVVGELPFFGQSRCTRCVIVTTNQETGDRQARGEPLRTLTAYRRAPELGNKPVFGRNFTHASTGIIRLGDQIKIVNHR